MFWLSYECFSILCNAFLLKSAISKPYNSCDKLNAQNTNFIRKIKRELKLSFFYHVQLIDNTFDTSFSEIR